MEYPHTASFRFEGRLTALAGEGIADHLYRFSGRPSLKDAVEALGVPHVEVGGLLVNGVAAAGDAALRPGDTVTVLPDETPFPEGRFVLDVHLGSLTRALRLLGFDCAYRNDYEDPEIVAISAAEGRAALTRDIGLLKHKKVTRGYWLRSQDTEEQLHEVLTRFGLTPQITPFTRCLRCNGRIRPVPEESVIAQIPPRVLGFQKEYFQCQGCNKVYWKGTHYDRMRAFIERIRA